MLTPTPALLRPITGPIIQRYRPWHRPIRAQVLPRTTAAQTDLACLVAWRGPQIGTVQDVDDNLAKRVRDADGRLRARLDERGVHPLRERRTFRGADLPGELLGWVRQSANENTEICR